MMNLLTAVLLLLAFDCHAKGGACKARVIDNKKIEVTTLEQKYHREGAQTQYAEQRETIVIKDYTKEYLLSVFSPRFDSGTIKVADSSYSINAGTNTVMLYRHKIKGVPAWFVVILDGDCKWLTYLDQKDISSFTETIGNITFSKD
ncbi:hypothetical protein [Taibaiella soli]|uniref:Uncharacterized protein n=1 Tax=Taibaiella soli TaxID=1649169 RepID=A0A2W2BD05_9BACT|nr:hypothetical protein [Taibaiella soli]PZF73747.1 hypothetical protein DN068_07050 [Taibaiella soli]